LTILRIKKEREKESKHGIFNDQTTEGERQCAYAARKGGNNTAEQFLCFRLQSGDKVGTGSKIFFKFFLLFLWHDMPCNITQQLIENKDTH